LRITYRSLAGPVGAFSPSRRKQAFRRAPSGTTTDGAGLKVWEYEGGSLRKRAPVR